MEGGTSPTPVANASAAAIDFAPVREMRPGEQLLTPYRLEIRGVKPGTHKLRVTATSSLLPAGAATEADATELREFARAFRSDVVAWLERNHPELL